MNDIPEEVQKFLKPQSEIDNANNTEKKDILDDVSTTIQTPQPVETLATPSTEQIEIPNNKVESIEQTKVVNPFEEQTQELQTHAVETEQPEEVLENTQNLQTFEATNMPSTPFNEQVVALNNEITNKQERQKSLQEQLDEIRYEEKPPTIDELNTDQYLNKIERIETEKVEIPKEIFEIEMELSDDDGEISLPKVINKVRDFTRNLGRASNLISTEEIDLPDSYQITIQIKK